MSDLLELDIRKRLETEDEASRAEIEKDLINLIFYEPIVSMEEFIFGHRYLNLPREAVYPRVVDLLIQIDRDDIREAFLCTGKGAGKSTITSIMLARQIYRKRNFRDFTGFFRVLPGTTPAVINMSLNADQAKNVIFTKLYSLLLRSPCFQNELGDPTFTKKERQIDWHDDLVVLSGHSEYRAYFGYDCWAGCLDEVSWFKDSSEKSVSDEIYQGIKASAITRFPTHYKIVCISSPQAEDDFLMRRVEEGRKYGTRVLLGEVDGDSYAKVRNVT
jgi:hypothetical protein